MDEGLGFLLAIYVENGLVLVMLVCPAALVGVTKDKPEFVREGSRITRLDAEDLLSFITYVTFRINIATALKNYNILVKNIIFET